MTLQDLYNNIESNPKVREISPLFDTYMSMFDAWTMLPSPHSPVLTNLSKLLQDIQQKFPEELASVMGGEEIQNLGLPINPSPPAYRQIDKLILKPRPESPTAPFIVPPPNAYEDITVKEPSLVKKAANFVSAMTDFAASGFKTVTAEQLEERKAICRGCKFFEPGGYGGLGKCRKCGCSGYKLNVAASRCPMGYWDAVE